MPEPIKIFISSSIRFAGLREEIRLFFDAKNKIYRDRLFFETVVCEDFDNPFGEATQKQYNGVIAECKYLLLFFSNRVGMYTKEEFLVSANSRLKTYVYKLPDDLSSESIADPDSVAQFRELLAQKGYFENVARSIDQLLLKFYTDIERNDILDLIANPLLKEQFFLSRRSYQINRRNPLAYFYANIRKQEQDGCTLFIYKGTKKDQPNYYNYRLDEKLNGSNVNLPLSFRYIKLGNVFHAGEEPAKWLIRFLSNFNDIYEGKIRLESDYASPEAFIAGLYSCLKKNHIDHLVLPFCLSGRLELDDELLVKQIISFLRLFDFQKGDGSGVFLHFVFNIDIDNEKETHFYREMSQAFNVIDYIMLDKIQETDLSEWSEQFSDNANKQAKLVGKIKTSMQELGYVLPAPMTDVDEAVQELIDKME